MLHAASSNAERLQNTPPVAIRAGAVVDVMHGTVHKDQIILVADGKIKAVGPHLAIPDGAEVIDLSREWVAPGLMDAHTHMTVVALAGDGPFETFYLAAPTRSVSGWCSGPTRSSRCRGARAPI